MKRCVAVVLGVGACGRDALGQCQVQWLEQPASGNLNGSVTALGRYEKALVAGGTFTAASGVPASHVALWGAGVWEPLGSGTNGTVFAFEELGGNLIAGGDFTIAGGLGVNHVARWNGAAWAQLGGGLAFAAGDFAIYNGELIACPAFNTTTPTPGFIGAVGKWDGESWDALGAGPGFGVLALVEHQGFLVAGGAIPIGLHRYARVARWDGMAWQGMGTIPPGGDGNDVRVLGVHSGGLVAGGWGFLESSVYVWTGKKWAPLGQADEWVIGQAFSSYRGELYGAGMNLGIPGIPGIGRWNGATWSALGSGANGDIHALVLHDGELIVGGAFTVVGQLSSPRWARWGCPCYPDCNNDAQLTVADFGCFQTQFVLGHPYTDCNSDGALTVADFGCFQTRFVQGCP